MFVHHSGNALLYISCSLNERLALSVSKIMCTTDKNVTVSLYRECRLSACYGIVQYRVSCITRKRALSICQQQRCRSAGAFLQFDLHLSLVVRKPVIGVFDQVRHKPVCTATEDG